MHSLAVAILAAISLTVGCPGDSTRDEPSGPCPNNIGSDEVCADLGCVKNYGNGASYCGDPCDEDGDCAGASNPWAAEDVTLVCHPRRDYCTRPCVDASECALPPGDESTLCDIEGVCGFL